MLRIKAVTEFFTFFEVLSQSHLGVGGHLAYKNVFPHNLKTKEPNVMKAVKRLSRMCPNFHLTLVALWTVR